MNDIIKITNLYLSVNNKAILHDINLSVQHGESLVIIGESGAGKSVLLKAIIGFLKYDSGEITIEGKKVIYPVERNISLHNIGMVFQHNALFDSLPVWENITFGLLQKRSINRNIAKQQALEKLQLVGLDESILDKYPHELSGGMQKRIAILRTVILQPKIILFDEPTSGLDPLNSDLIARFITNIASDITKIIITHDMRLMKAIADRVAMLQAGKIIWDGANDAMHTVEHDYVKSFIT